MGSSPNLQAAVARLSKAIGAECAAMSKADADGYCATMFTTATALVDRLVALTPGTAAAYLAPAPAGPAGAKKSSKEPKKSEQKQGVSPYSKAPRR